MKEFPREDLAMIYSSANRVSAVEIVFDRLSEKVQDAVDILRYARIALYKAEMSETTFLALDLAVVLVEAGLSASAAQKVADCFNHFFDFDAYICSKNLEELEMSLIKNELLDQVN